MVRATHSVMVNTSVGKKKKKFKKGLIEHSSYLIKNVTPYPMRPNIAAKTLVKNA